MTTKQHKPIKPSSALFIKLGQGGEWEEECIGDGTLWLGFSEFSHDDLIAKKYDLVRNYYKTTTSSQWVTIYENQIKNFYETDETVLWITFYDQRLWWCFADKKFKGEGIELKLRYVKDKWRCTDIFGNELLVDNLSGQLLKTQGFQSTNVIGGPQKTKDIELLSPVTNERILVQVKCSSSFKQYEDYETRFSGMEGYDRFFYVVHTPDKKLSVHQP